MPAASVSATKTLPGVPPGPKGRFLLGSLVELSRDWLGFYARCAREHGDLVYFHILHVPLYLVVHPRDIEFILVTNAGNFSMALRFPAPPNESGKPWKLLQENSS